MLKIDRQIIENFLAGEKKSTAILFDKLRRPMFAFLYRMACDRNVAEDLLQETLLIIHARKNTFNRDCEFMPWAWTIARNKFYEFKRSQNRVIRLIPQPFSDHEGQHSFANSSDTETDLRNCLDTLSETTKEAFILKHLQGMTFNEIAELQQIPLPTAKSRVLFALKKIREYFNRGEI